MTGRPELHPPPASIVDPHGRPAFGVYDRPFESANLDEARLPLGWVRLGRRVSSLRLKQWQHFLLLLPDAVLTFAIVDSGFLRVSWCHFADHDGRCCFEHERKGPLMGMGIARSLWKDRTFVHAHRYRIDVDNRLSAGEHEIRMLIAGDASGEAVEADLRCLHDLKAITPLVVVLPVGRGQAMYTHKVPLPLEGRLRVGGREIEARPEDSFAILDVHKAHYPRHTWWNWATFAGRDDAGRTIALNLTSNVNRRDNEYSENALWVDGKLEMLAPARFELDPGDALAPWHVSTADGAVDLRFEPKGKRGDDLDLGLARSVFQQPYGVFFGKIRSSGGIVRVREAWGVCEDHDALW